MLEVNLLVKLYAEDYKGGDVSHLGLVWTPEEIKQAVEKKVSVLLHKGEDVELPTYYHTDYGTGDLGMPWFMSFGSPNLCFTDFSNHDGFLQLTYNEVKYTWQPEGKW